MKSKGKCKHCWHELHGDDDFELDICQHCLKEKLGAFIRNVTPTEKDIEPKISKMIESQHESERNLYLKEENKELRTRVAELEKKAEEYEATKQTDRSFEALMNYQIKLNELQNRLSTLLKASEGMEKALEKIATCGYSDAPELEQDQHQIAQSALADFRAVKETMNAKKEYDKSTKKEDVWK